MVRTAWYVFVWGEAWQADKKPSKAAGFKTKFKIGCGSLQVVVERGPGFLTQQMEAGWLQD